MNTLENTVSFNKRALQEEMRKRDEAAVRWETARDEVYRLLQEPKPDLRELVVAEAYAEHCAQGLRVQQAFVNSCREWVEKELKAQSVFQLEVERVRLRHSATGQSPP